MDVGTGALTSAELVLDLGAHHPSTHGALRLRITADGDRIVAADPVVGYVHRGAEKLFEVRDYRQIMVLANRHDWLSAFGSELGVALAVEQMLGMDVPERSTWLRTALAELQRILNALMFLGEAGFEQRERVQAVLEEASGGRTHAMFNRIGGLKEDVPLGWVGRVRAVVDTIRQAPPTVTGGHGVGVLSRESWLQFGVSGPVARASGLDLDPRRDSPYLAYAELGFGGERFPVVTSTVGDAHARLDCMVRQVAVSLDLVDACLDALPAGPVNVKLPKTVKAGEGAAYVWTENPLGINGYWIVSRGEKTPWRCKLRTASFNTVQVLSELLPGTSVSDLPTVLGSLMFVLGDVDK